MYIITYMQNLKNEANKTEVDSQIIENKLVVTSGEGKAVKGRVGVGD